MREREAARLERLDREFTDDRIVRRRAHAGGDRPQVGREGRVPTLPRRIGGGVGLGAHEGGAELLPTGRSRDPPLVLGGVGRPDDTLPARGAQEGPQWGAEGAAAGGGGAGGAGGIIQFFDAGAC